MGQAYMRFECLTPQNETRCPYDLQLQIKSDRHYAAAVLGDLKDPRAVPALISVLSVPTVNLGAIWSLAKIDDKRAVDPLIAVLASNDPTVQVTAIRALEKMDAKESIPGLYCLVKEKDRSQAGDLIPVEAGSSGSADSTWRAVAMVRMSWRQIAVRRCPRPRYFSGEDIRASNMVGACLFAFYRDLLLCGDAWSRPSWRMSPSISTHCAPVA
jgi:hypothetical protein